MLIAIIKTISVASCSHMATVTVRGLTMKSNGLFQPRYFFGFSSFVCKHDLDSASSVPVLCIGGY